MRLFKILCAFLCATAMLSTGIAFAAVPEAASQKAPSGRLWRAPTPGTAASYRAGEVLIKFKGGTGRARQKMIETSSSVSEVIKSVGPEGHQDLKLAKLAPGVNVESAVQELKAQPEVEFAEPNYIVQSEYNPGDSEFSRQWGLNNTGQTVNSHSGTAGADIRAKKAWDIEKGNSHAVNVAVIDSGIDYSHPDLDSKVWTNSDETSGNLVDDDGNGYVDDHVGYNYAGISQYHDYYYDSGAGSWEYSYWALGYDAGKMQLAQSFIARAPAGETQRLTGLGIELATYNNPTNAITVSIRSSLAGANLTSYSIAASEVSSDPTEVYKDFSSPLDLNNGSTYYIVVAVAGSPSTSDYYALFDNWGAEDGTFNGYQEGREYQWNGSSWASWLNDDLYFRTNDYGYAYDNNGHGTHVSGIIAAESNTMGVAGVSFGSNTKIMPLKTQDSSGSGSTSDIVNAVYYAADNGARIINMSLGSGTSSSSFASAVTYAYNKGVCVFASAGNDGDTSINYPASYPNVVSVGATDNRDNIAEFSNQNSYVDVSAPGVDIYSTMPTYAVGLNDVGCSQTYSFMSGTSMASPMAAGVGALLRSKFPSLTPAQVASKMQTYANDKGAPGRDNAFGYGRVNAYAALSGKGSDDVVQPTSSVWYLAEGSTKWGFDCYVTIQNPLVSDLNAKVTFMTTEGPVSMDNVHLPSGSQTTINPGGVFGERDFSTKVQCVEGQPIAVDREMYWTAPGTEYEGAHCSVGVTGPAKQWYLPEGSSQWGFECWLLLQNPNTKPANCTVTYMIEGVGPRNVTHQVPANSRQSYSMADDIGAGDASIKVTSDLPVIPERSMYRNNRREGHDSIGTTTPAANYYLAEGTSGYGFTTYVLVQNPGNNNATVNITYMTPKGPVAQPAFIMPPTSRKTICVNDVLPGQDFSTQVHANTPIITERAMYWNNGTGEAMHDSIGLSGAHNCFFLPDGRSDAGFETWTLVQNPNDTPVTVNVTYLYNGGGEPDGFTESIPARSRRTYNMEDTIGPDAFASITVSSETAGKNIMVERAIYGQNRGSGTDTIGGYYDGFSAPSGLSMATSTHGRKSKTTAAPTSGLNFWR